MTSSAWTGDSTARRPISEIVAALAREAPHRPLLTCNGATATRLELELFSNRLARAYEMLGVRRGSLVAIALPNGIEFFCTAFAVWKLGAIPLPLSYVLPDVERSAIVELADCDLVVGANPASHRGRVCVAEGFRPDPGLSCGPITPARVAPSWKAPTSGGSTGRPKIIVSGQDGNIDPALGQRRYGMRPDGVVLIPGPLYHNAPFTQAMLATFLGNHVVVLDRFEAGACLRAIGEYGIEWVSLVPTMMLRIWRELQSDPGGYCLRSLRQVWHMAAPCPGWLKEAWIQLIGAERLMELYGGTEGQATTVISGVEWLRRRGSVGRPVFGRIKILDEDGKPVPAGVTGEIFMRWDGSCPPYYYIGAVPRSRDGWESLGDLGWLDQDGYLYLADRRTDMILSGGANVYPAEVEAALLAHPAVASCVVVGLPDEDLGQRVHAIVQTRAELDRDDLRRFLATLIVRYKIPRSFRFVSGSLRDDAGKVRRTLWRDIETARLGL
jgi:bile acid-coenzyme A ligase